ncbi:hypothetical protein ASE16_05035 [Leifsonia sp. Root227]|uniref:hypothetical protein n=1 Tax=unclassified Leifsonia TaxID=2663824 RepID=UPI00070163B6|nr:hypothetical protein [Leifsonia sp. Root227]KRC50403.1 hypothetical protein ASE16_05035 [Leifsonia sp. Root227]
MPKRDRLPADYTVPKTARLRRRLFWRLRRMRAAVDVETLEVFEHELAAFERGGVAEIERQRTRNMAAAAARVIASQKREELIRGSIERTERQLERAEVAAERLDARLLGHDPDLHNFA